MKRKMQEIQTDKLCECCGKEPGRYVTKKGKIWCADNPSKCPGIKKKIGTKSKENLSSIDPESGLSKAQTYANKKKEEAADAGLEDPYHTAALKMAKTRRENGSYDDFSKALATKNQIGEDGLTTFQRASIKMQETRNKIGEDGLTCFERASIKSTKTRLNDIDEKGRNGFDRLWIKAGQAKPFVGTKLYYRSDLERKFLQEKVREHSLDWVNENVQNPKSIEYDGHGKKRRYIPDFLIGNTLYEVKSSYTLDNFGNNAEWLDTNIKKLDAASAKGFRVILVLDEEEIVWEESRKFYIQKLKDILAKNPPIIPSP